MPSIKCPTCGHRILLPTTFKSCSNCGTALADTTPPPQTSTSTGSLPPARALVPFNSVQAEEDQPSLLDSIFGSSSSTSDLDSLSKSRTSESYNTFQHTTQSQKQQLEEPQSPISQLLEAENVDPFQITAVPPERAIDRPKPPRRNVPGPVINNNNNNKQLSTSAPTPAPALAPNELNTLAWKNAKSFFFIPPPTPPLQGTILNIQQNQDLPGNYGFPELLLRFIRDLIWPVQNEQQNYQMMIQNERTNVSLIRVRTEDGSLRDARMVGSLTGANVALGDNVAFWGRKSKGVLQVTRAYNNTSDAYVTARTPVQQMNPLPMMLFLVGVALLVWFLLTFNIFSFDLGL